MSDPRPKVYCHFDTGAFAARRGKPEETPAPDRLPGSAARDLKPTLEARIDANGYSRDCLSEVGPTLIFKDVSCRGDYALPTGMIVLVVFAATRTAPVPDWQQIRL
jgi:hypothetical protein